MNFLQYKSDEMVSSTQLIRKSKSLFDKLSKNEIEKAVILRDGKPSFLLMEFDKYERIMKEYLALKSGTQISDKKTSKNEVTKVVEEKPQIESSKEKEINDEELKSALEKIDAIALDELDEDKQKLKEFWD